MNRTYVVWLCVLVFLSLQTTAQDILALKIPAPDASRILLQFNNGQPMGPEQELPVSANGWSLKVTNSVAGIKVVLRNMEGDAGSVVLDEPSGNYTIQNNRLAEKNFNLQKNIRLLILDANGGEIKKYDIRIAAVSAGVSGQPAGGNSSDYKPGLIFYDAFFLADENNSPAVKFKILSLYANNISDTALLREFYAGNKFMEPLVNNVFNRNLQQSGGVLSSVIASVGNLNVTKFADGLAKFIVERSKEELNVAFFRKFQQFINHYPEVKRVFPTTYLFLQNIYSYQYAAMLPALRAGFQKDMNAFAKNLIDLRNLTGTDCPDNNVDCQNRVTGISDFLTNNAGGRSIIAALIIADNLLKGNNAADVLDNLANDPVCSHTDENFSNTVQFINLISRSVRSNKEDEVWVDKKEINRLIANEQALKIYLGLLYATDKQRKTDSIRFNINGTVRSFRDFLAALHTNWPNREKQFKTALKAAGYTAADVSAAAKNISVAESKGDESSILIYARYASALSTFLKSSIDFIGDSTLFEGFEQLKKDALYFTGIIDPAVDACYDIKSQNYTALVLHTSLLLENILRNKDYTFKDNYLKYGTFMASIAEAKNSDDVKNAIEAAVLPVGSSSIKRETGFNIAINSFIGPFAGQEYLPKLKKDKWASVIGVTVPVGIAFSWGNLKSKKLRNGKEVGGKSFSIFIPLIDIGSMATFRLGDDSSVVASEVQLKNIVSPGFFLYYGFGKCPVSVGIGGQLGPQLREVTAKDVFIDKNYYFRFGINVVVDIPLFNLYTKTK